MIEPVEFLTIYCCFEDVATVSRMLPTVLDESQRAGAAVVVHDCSVNNRSAMSALIQDLRRKHTFFFVHSDAIPMGLARNMAMWIALEIYAPTYICMIEDDHGYSRGLIPEMVDAMKKLYGKKSPSGLRYGMFTACPFCWGSEYLNALVPVEGGVHRVVDASRVAPMMAGGTNSCFRCAPTSHWISVLRGYDVDEYPISTFQTAGINFRNYHKGFTTLVVCNGDLAIRHEREGRGFTTTPNRRPFNLEYAARDCRSGFNFNELDGDKEKLTKEQSFLRGLQNKDYSHLSLLSTTEESVKRVQHYAESIYGDQWNFYSNALRREVVNSFEVCILELSKNGKTIDYLEIGSCQGLSMSIIGAILRDQNVLGRLVSIDPYFTDGYAEGGHSVWGKDIPIAVNKKTKTNAFRLYGQQGLEVNHIEDISIAGLKQLINDCRKFDLIYIDGSHEGLNPLMDFYNSLALLAKGGIIILDDHHWPDVKVIKELCDRHLVKIVECWKVAAYRPQDVFLLA